MKRRILNTDFNMSPKNDKILFRFFFKGKIVSNLKTENKKDNPEVYSLLPNEMKTKSTLTLFYTGK